MAFNLGASIKKGLSSPVVNNISQRINSAIPSVNTSLMSSSLVADAKSAFSNAAVGSISSKVNGALGSQLGGILTNELLNGLNANAEELTGLIETPLKIVERGAADLAGVTGGEYGLIREQYLELTKRTAYAGYVDNTFIPAYAPDKSGASKVPNPLRDHASFNYVVTLGVLSAAEYNNPELYRSAGGFESYVIKSSGGNLDKRTQVFDETGGGSSEHAEYYIEDLEIDAVITPNQNTGIALGTDLNFNVIEPYSMGNFIQAIIAAAREAGYGSYQSAPFCIKIDFVGWNLDGKTDANFVQRPIFIPIKLINMEFNVSGQGSRYAVQAVPMSETGLADNINKIKTPVKATGLLCHEVLETNDASVTSAINSHIETLEEAGALAPFDRYIIAFPQNRTTLVNALKQGNVEESAFTTSPEEREAQRTAATAGNPQLRAAFNEQVITITPGSQTYAVLKSFAENTDLMNEIGKSFLNEDTNAPGNSSEADASAVINPDTEIVDTTSVAAQPAEKARDFQFNQNESITSIIEKIVLQTSYAAEKCTENSSTGLNKWFKIDTYVFIDESPLTEQQAGRRPKVYVYCVMPYEVDEAITAGPNGAPANTQGLKEAAVKEYNYIYTGKNEDVLNFDINFNNAFLLTAMSDLGMNSGNTQPDAGTVAATQDKDSGTVINPNAPVSGEEGSPAVELDSQGNDIQPNTQINDVKRQIAEMFHQRIRNMTVDMVTAEMEIMGDPYFLPQEMGNYVAELGDRPGVTKDGTMTYQTGPVYCVVNFKTPFDYQIKGATMEFPENVPGFSGIYQVWAVVNKFSAGKFTQTIKLLRRRGQDNEETPNPKNAILVDNSSATSNKTVQSDGTVGQTNGGIDCFPAPANDDIRNLGSAVGNDIISETLGPLVEQAQQLSNIDNVLQEGFDAVVAKAPDLTKVIPGAESAINAAITGISTSPMVPVGKYSSARLPGVMGSIRPGDETNALDVLAAQAEVVNQARDAALGGVNRAVDSVTGATKSRVNKLLGPF